MTTHTKAGLKEGKTRETELPLAEQDARRLVRELQTHQIELELQNEELKRSREQLERQLEKYSDLYDFAPVGYLTLDGDGTIREANLTAAKLLGTERSVLVGRRFSSFLSDESVHVFGGFLRNVRDKVATGVYEVALQGDRARYLQIEGTAVESGEGIIGDCRMAVMDISRRRRAEELLRASEERYRSYIEVTGELGWTTDGHGEVVEDLPMWRRYTGQSPEQIKGAGWATALHPDDLGHTMAVWNNAVVTESAYEVEYRVRRHDGVYRYFLARGVPVFKQDGTIREWVGTCIDITERTAAGDALNQANRTLTESKAAVDLIVEERTFELTKAYESLRLETEQRQRTEAQLRQAFKMEALGTLAGGIAHDFNNILAAIIGFSEMAQDKTPEGSPARRHMERVFKAGLRGRDLIRQILTFSRKAEGEKQPLKLATTVRETLSLLRASLPSTIDIRMNLESGPGFVLADPTQMQQIILNLCTNAAYAMRRTGGSISIDLAGFSFTAPEDAPEPTMNPGPYTRLSVEDTGEGMSSDVLGRVFDPFFTTKAAGKGTGLGLSVVHGIVAGHGGAITASSESGKGSTFTVYLPRFVDAHSRDSRDGDDSIPRGHERILFIDDEEDLAAIGDEMLTDLGYRVTVKTQAREALAFFRLDPFQFDLVITDQTMPAITGEELAKEILATRADTPIVMCTGFSDLIDADSAEVAGIKAFAIKPLTKREIAVTIRKALGE